VKTAQQRLRALKQDTMITSVPWLIEEHPEFQNLVKMARDGERVIPALHEDLKKSVSMQAILALREIVGSDPYDESVAGDIYAIGNAWLDWLEQGAGETAEKPAPPRAFEKDFDESKHPRDEHGRWTDGGGGGDGDSEEYGGRDIALSSGKYDADLPETQKLLTASEADVGDITDVTEYPVEGVAGYLTPSGRTLDVGPLSHATAAEDAGTTLEAVLDEGTARIYAGGGFLGIEIVSPPTAPQLRELIKMSKVGEFDRFAVETPGGPSKVFEGVVTANVIRNTIKEAFEARIEETTTGPKPEGPVGEPEPFIASTNIFTTRFAKVKDQVGFGKSDKGGARVTWTQKGSVAKIAEHAREAVVQLGGTNREYAALVGKAHSLPSKVSLIEGSKHSVPLGNQAEILLTTTGQTFDLYHNHPYPYPLSMPDLGYLNNNPTLISIREDDVGGAYSSATIPGREHLGNKVPAWTNWNKTIATFENSVIAEHMKGPLKEVIKDLKSKIVEGTMTAEEGSHVMNFIGQFAQVTALDKVGIIKLEYKLSDWQQKQLDTYPKQFKEASKIALARARLAKNKMKMVDVL
jgi:hypothetical protein